MSLALALQLVLLLAVLFLILRKPSPAPQADPRLALLPDQLTRVDARLEASDAHLRTALAQLRSDLASEAANTRQQNASADAVLRNEIASRIEALGHTLTTGLTGFRSDNKTSDEALRRAVLEQLDALTRHLGAFTTDINLQQTHLRESINSKLTDLTASNSGHQEKLRATVEARLDQLNATNSVKLEEMRATVDEKLHATLQSRLTESFGQVTDQLNKVHVGLGEMAKLSEGVDDLSRIFTNVKSRGGFAEVQLGMLLDQMLAPSQFVRNARVKPNTQEVVEFAVRFPGVSGETLLPIDAKFPREDWERLEAAYASNNPITLAAAGKAFETAIRTEGKRICEKYINPPVTTPHAIMFLPTEGLYAEVMRRDALQAEIQSKCQVTIAGPSTLSAILTSFQMGFHMLAMQEKGDEVWKVLETAKTEFGKFGGLMDKVEKQVGTVQNTLREIRGKTTTINRNLRDVTLADPSADNLLSFEGIAPSLAAGEEIN